MDKKLKSEVISYLESRRHNATTDIKNAMYVLENINDIHDIAYKETKKHVEDKINELDLLLSMLDRLKKE